MSVVSPVGIYTVRIPTELRHVFYNEHDDTRVNLTQVCDLNKLANILPLEDIFYLVYEQTTDKGFIQFLSETKLTSFLQLPENINWLLSVKDQYDAYIRKREDALKVKSDTVFHLTTPIQETHTYNGCKMGNSGLLLTFVPIDEGSSPILANGQMFNTNLLYSLFRLLGYDAVRKHPIVRYLLTI